MLNTMALISRKEKREVDAGFQIGSLVFIYSL